MTKVERLIGLELKKVLHLKFDCIYTNFWREKTDEDSMKYVMNK